MLERVSKLLIETLPFAKSLFSPARAGVDVTTGLRHVLNAIGEAGRGVNRAVGSPDADGKPVGDVVVEAAADQDRTLVFVEQGERDGRRQLDAPLAPQDEAGALRARRPRDQSVGFLALPLGGWLQLRQVAPRAPGGFAASSPLS